MCECAFGGQEEGCGLRHHWRENGPQKGTFRDRGKEGEQEKTAEIEGD